MEKLVATLKVATHNIEVIHRCVYGKDFFSVHELTRGYYQKLSEMTDDIIETFMSIGFYEPGLENSTRLYPSLRGQKIKTYDAYVLVYDIFADITKEIDAIKETLPHDISDKLMGYKVWLRKEMDYKLKRISNSVE